jgi:hypothetical protein
MVATIAILGDARLATGNASDFRRFAEYGLVIATTQPAT